MILRAASRKRKRRSSAGSPPAPGRGPGRGCEASEGEGEVKAPVLQGAGLVVRQQVLVDEAVVAAVRLRPVDVLRDGLHEAPPGVLDVGDVVHLPRRRDVAALVLGDGQAARVLVGVDGRQGDERLQHVDEVLVGHGRVDQPVADGLEVVEVLVAESQHVARVVRLLLDVLRVPALPHVLGLLHAPLERVLADHPDGRGVHADGGVAVVPVGEADVRRDLLVGVAADEDLPVEAGQSPDFAAVVQAAGGVVVGVAPADDLVEEVESLAVLDDVVVGGDDAQRLARVHADVGDLVRDGDFVHLVVVADDEVGVDGVLLHRPVQPGEAHGLLAGNHVLVDDGSEAVPRGLPVAVEGVVVLHDAVAHGRSPFFGCVLTVPQVLFLFVWVLLDLALGVDGAEASVRVEAEAVALLTLPIVGVALVVVAHVLPRQTADGVPPLRGGPLNVLLQRGEALAPLHVVRGVHPVPFVRGVLLRTAASV